VLRRSLAHDRVSVDLSTHLVTIFALEFPQTLRSQLCGKS